MRQIFCSAVSHPNNSNINIIMRQISVVQYLTQIILIIYNNANNEEDLCSAVSRLNNDIRGFV